MDQPKPIQPSDSLSRQGKRIDEAWADCLETIVPRHMKANLHARSNTKVSRSVAYEARSARFFYRTNRGFSGASNKENLTIQIQRDVDSGLSNSFVCRRNEPIRGLAHPQKTDPETAQPRLDSVKDLPSKAIQTTTGNYRQRKAAIRRQAISSVIAPCTWRRAPCGSAPLHQTPLQMS